jgi:ornithine cyclodeaminase/alanine dehydrogenase-like protein (mu-crystallin family)
MLKVAEDVYREYGEGKAANEPRRRIHVTQPDGVHTRLSVHIGGIPSLGVIGYFSHNQRVIMSDKLMVKDNLDAPFDATVLFDIKTGGVLSVILGKREMIADITGALNIVGVKYLARADASSVGVLGAGTIATSSLRMVTLVRKITEVKCYSPNKNHRESFCREMSKQLALDIVPVDRPRDAIRGADIVLCCTNSNVPVIHGDWLEKGQCVLTQQAAGPAGLDGKMGRREIDMETVTRSDVIVATLREQVKVDNMAQLMEPLNSGLITWDKIWELPEVLTGKVPGRTDDRQIALFDQNTNQGLNLVATFFILYRRAKERGLGVEF